MGPLLFWDTEEGLGKWMLTMGREQGWERGQREALPLSAGSSAVRETRPTKGMLGCHIERQRGVQAGAALCRPEGMEEGGERHLLTEAGESGQGRASVGILWALGQQPVLASQLIPAWPTSLPFSDCHPPLTGKPKEQALCRALPQKELHLGKAPREA